MGFYVELPGSGEGRRMGGGEQMLQEDIQLVMNVSFVPSVKLPLGFVLQRKTQ
jgi:hypothetical protein